MKNGSQLIVSIAILIFACTNKKAEQPEIARPTPISVSPPIENLQEKDTPPPEKVFDKTKPIDEDNYPGLREGEIFLTNLSPSLFEMQGQSMIGTSYPPSNSKDISLAIIKQFGDMRWKTKRLGRKAYSESGTALEDMRPVFVQRAELEKAGLRKKLKK